VLIFFIVIDFAYLSANTIKIPHGGWFPLLMAAFLFTLMTTWGRGREVLAIRLRERLRPLEKFVQQIKDENPTRVPGTAIFMMRSTEGTPPAIIHNLKHNKVVHERVVVLSIVMGDVPHVPVSERLDIEELGAGFYRVLAHFGFMDSPDVQLLLESLRYRGLKIEMDELTFFLGRETLLATTKPGMAIWREKLFAFMSRNAQSAMEFFKIPPDRVVEIGLQVEL